MKQKCLDFKGHERILLVMTVLGEEPMFWLYNDRLMQVLCTDNIFMLHTTDFWYSFCKTSQKWKSKKKIWKDLIGNGKS